MDTDRWHKIEVVFHAALERPAAEREAFVQASCDGDGALAAEVMALLAADQSPHSLLERRAVDAVGELRPALPEGTRVGSYRVLERVAVGGMGAVYLAERADGQFEQRVALKVIRRGMDSESSLARFHAERRILARLQHPNIARLIDGGLTGDGLPYFTMEYVDGRPITDYSDENRLSIEQRLELFQHVCASVQYAHGSLIVHRDLKPSNILVTRDGEVKLLDFGIAHVMGEDEAGLTRTGQRVMTPAYASPEQVRGEPVTTASDVYSLGVVLYELLCGRHPHRDTASTPAELERAISTAPVEKPSKLVTDGEPAAEDVANARRSQPRKLRKRLEGDLDTICLTALRKEPERRYASVSRFLDDIRNHMAGQPVSARPDTMLYRTGKFVRRNRVAVATAAGLGVLLIALTAFYTTRLAHERDRARLEARKAEEVSRFLSGLFASADPSHSRGESITAREMLDDGRGRVRRELAGQPAVAAEMLRVIGVAYQNLGLFAEADSAFAECLELHRHDPGEDAAEALALAAIGALRNERGEYAEGERLGQQAVAIGRALGRAGLEALASGLDVLGSAINGQGRFAAAETHYRESVETWKQLHGPQSEDASVVMNNLALLFHEQSRYDEAEVVFQEALATQDRVFGPRHPETASTRYNYAQLLADTGHLEPAKAMWEEVLATDRALYPDGHPNIAYTLSAYARLLSRLGEFEKAETFEREALGIRKHFHGEDHPDVAYSMGSLARVLLEQARYDEAEALFRGALAKHLALNGPDHPIVGSVMNDIGKLLYERGQYDAAEKMHREALAFFRTVKAEEELNAMAVSMLRLANDLAAVGRLAEADTLAANGLALTRRLHSDRGHWAAAGFVDVANIRFQMGAVAQAETLFAVGLERLRALESSSPARPRDVRALLGLGRCRLAQDDVAGAEARFREAVEIERRYRRPGHPGIARAEAALAEAIAARGAQPTP
jgi:serine/threonine-protein kinase